MAEPSSLCHDPRNSGVVRVFVRIQQDEDGYPGVDIEGLWCAPEGRYHRIDNIPFFAPGLACGDLIRTRAEGDQLWLEALIEESGHATVWAICRDEQMKDEVRSSAASLGCSSELSHNPRYVSIDVPPEVDRAAVRRMLDLGEQVGKWEFAEGVAM